MSLWAVLGLWWPAAWPGCCCCRQVAAAMVTLGLTVAFVAGWRLVHPGATLRRRGRPDHRVGGVAVRWPTPSNGRFHPGAGVVARLVGVPAAVGGRHGHHRPDEGTARHRLRLAAVAIRCNRWMDQVTVRMLPGQRLQDWVDVADRFAQTFGALDCRVRSCPNSQRCNCGSWSGPPRPGRAAPRSRPRPRQAAGRRHPGRGREDGGRWLKIVGSHVLLVGSTGAGKSPSSGRSSAASRRGSPVWAGQAVVEADAEVEACRARQLLPPTA